MNPEPEGRQFFYCNDNVTVEGPYTWDQLLEFYGNGIISSATAICQAGSDDWAPFGDFMLAGEQVLEHSLPIAEELPEQSTASDAIPVDSVQGKPSHMTPKRWAAVVGAVVLVAIVAYSGVRMLGTNSNKPTVAAVQTPASLESRLAEAKTKISTTTTLGCKSNIELKIDNALLRWSMRGRDTGYLYFKAWTSHRGRENCWAFAPCAKKDLQSLEVADFQKGDFVREGEKEKVTALFDPDHKVTGGGAIPVQENQVILAKQIDAPQKVYALHLVNQNPGNTEQITAEYLSLSLDADAAQISAPSSAADATTPNASGETLPPYVEIKKDTGPNVRSSERRLTGRSQERKIKGTRFSYTVAYEYYEDNPDRTPEFYDIEVLQKLPNNSHQGVFFHRRFPIQDLPKGIATKSIDEIARYDEARKTVIFHIGDQEYSYCISPPAVAEIQNSDAPSETLPPYVQLKTDIGPSINTSGRQTKGYRQRRSIKGTRFSYDVGYRYYKDKADQTPNSYDIAVSQQIPDYSNTHFATLFSREFPIQDLPNGIATKSIDEIASYDETRKSVIFRIGDREYSYCIAEQTPDKGR